MQADATMLSRSTPGAPNYGEDDDGLEQAIVSTLQDGVRGAALLRSMPATEDTPANGRQWSIWLLHRARDYIHGTGPAQRLRDILIAETRARHTGCMIRFLQDAADTARETQEPDSE